jgi:hypothetical protein
VVQHAHPPHMFVCSAACRSCVGYVSLLAFPKEKWTADMWADPTVPYYVCRTEWFDARLGRHGLAPILNLRATVRWSDICVEWRA